MRALWPVLGRVSLALSERGTVHASAAENGFALMSAAGSGRAPVRTVCGSDAFPVAHSSTAGALVIASWPAPVVDRCEDCSRILGLGGRERAGSYHWQQLRRDGDV